MFPRRRMVLLLCGRLPIRCSYLMLGSFFVLAQELDDGFLEVAAQLRPSTFGPTHLKVQCQAWDAHRRR